MAKWQDSTGKDVPQTRCVGYPPVRLVGRHGSEDRDKNGKPPKLNGSVRKGK